MLFNSYQFAWFTVQVSRYSFFSDFDFEVRLTFMENSDKYEHFRLSTLNIHHRRAVNISKPSANKYIKSTLVP